MNTLKRIQAACEQAALFISALSILLLGLLVFASVVGREVFVSGVPDDIVIAGLFMIPIIALPLAYVQSQDGHIAVTVTTNWLPARAIAGLKALGTVIGIVFYALLAWLTAAKIPRDFKGGGYYDGQLEILVWPMKVVFVVGVSLFVLRLVVDVVRYIGMAIGRLPVDIDETSVPDAPGN